MRAIVVELSDQVPTTGDLVLEGLARPIAEEPVRAVTPGIGSLAQKPDRREDHDEAEGEPW
jgi:hypothetical protein